MTSHLGADAVFGISGLSFSPLFHLLQSCYDGPDSLVQGDIFEQAALIDHLSGAPCVKRV